MVVKFPVGFEEHQLVAWLGSARPQGARSFTVVEEDELKGLILVVPYRIGAQGAYQPPMS